MLLAIDIGNTNIAFGVFNGKRLMRRYAVFTSSANYMPGLKKIFAKNSIDDAIVCSVVPKAIVRINHDLGYLLGKRPYNIGKEILVPIKNLYRVPAQVGRDRLVNAYAGCALYGAPLVVVDFGTAVTFDVVSKNKEYLGGMILPGLELSLDALAEGTALLPRIKLDKPNRFIGQDTKNSMLSGIVFGFAALTDNLTGRIKNEIGGNAKVIGTGGNIRLAAKYCKTFDKIDPDLTLKGLNLIYIKRVQKSA
ncbi:MAG: type III pantothenate kinase [Candidatus Omnitrophota bacterium]